MIIKNILLDQQLIELVKEGRTIYGKFPGSHILDCKIELETRSLRVKSHAAPSRSDISEGSEARKKLQGLAGHTVMMAAGANLFIDTRFTHPTQLKIRDAYLFLDTAEKTTKD